jgi:hypothetical protein
MNSWRFCCINQNGNPRMIERRFAKFQGRRWANFSGEVVKRNVQEIKATEWREIERESTVQGVVGQVQMLQRWKKRNGFDIA